MRWWSYLAAVVLHKSSSDVHMMPCAKILSGLLKDGAARLDAFSSSGKFHVLDIDLNNSRASKVSLSLFTVKTMNFPDISGRLITGEELIQNDFLKSEITQKSDTLWVESRFYSRAATLLLLFVDRKHLSPKRAELTNVGSISSMARKRLYILWTFSCFMRLCETQVKNINGQTSNCQITGDRTFFALMKWSLIV